MCQIEFYCVAIYRPDSIVIVTLQGSTIEILQVIPVVSELVILTTTSTESLIYRRAAIESHMIGV